MLSSEHLFVNGMTGMFSEDVAPTHTGQAMAAGDGGRRDLFGRFVSVYQSNEFLFAELESVKQKIARTNAYLETPASNPILARAQLRQLKARRSAVLTVLRANRLQARALLDRTETAVEMDVA